MQRTEVVASGTVRYVAIRRDLPVSYPLEITVDGETMTVRGLDPVLVEAFGGVAVEFPIERAPEGMCP